MVLKVENGDSYTKGSLWTISHSNREEKKYSYSEAIELAGNGWYSIGLLATMGTTTFAMGMDMFGFSMVVSGATCDFDLDYTQTGILLSMSFVGPIVMAFPWGYVSDTQGRRKSLLVAMWVGFIVSFISSFSPHWIIMAVLKFISTSFSSCAQSAAFTLLGESTSEKTRDMYILILTSVLDFSLAAYVSIAYFILNMNFVYQLGFITFTPWRLLNLVLALFLGLSGFCLYFFYESPKFLVNVDQNEEALDILRKIWRRNGGRGKYPVTRVYLQEQGNERAKDVSFVRSLWEQIVPLFKPPLLFRSIQLYFLTAVVYGTNNSYFMWFPFLAEKFTMLVPPSNSTQAQISGLCNVLVSEHIPASRDMACSKTVDISLVYASLAQGFSFVIILLAISKIAYRRKTLLILILLVSSLSCIGAVVINDSFTSFIMFFGVLFNELCVGFILSYFVDLYPTSYRGTAACIGVMVARASALGGINFLGAFIMSHCATMFYVCSALMFAAIAVSCLLPPDKTR